MDIDAVIAQATQSDANEVTAVEDTVSVNEVEADDSVDTNEVAEDNEDVGSKPDSELTPEQLAKREWNRKSHDRSKLARQARELRELREFKAQQEAKLPQVNPADSELDIDSFDTIQDYVKAEARRLYEQENSKQYPPVNPQAEAAAQRAQQVVQQEASFARDVPEYNKLINDNVDFFSEVAADQALQSAITQADNAPLALYALMKEDNLGALYGLPPIKVAMELAKAEIRGAGYLTPKKTATSAPQPITTARGTGSSERSLDRMSIEEKLKWLRT